MSLYNLKNITINSNKIHARIGKNPITSPTAIAHTTTPLEFHGIFYIYEIPKQGPQHENNTGSHKTSRLYIYRVLSQHALIKQRKPRNA